MSASSPAPVTTSPPKAAATSSSPPPPRDELLEDRGTSRHDSVHAHRWRAQGTVKVSRDVVVGAADVHGTTAIGGTVLASEFRARGSLDVEGAVDVRGSLTVHGNVHFAAGLRAVDLELDGCARVGGAVSVERTMTGRGSLEAPSLAAGVLSLEGSVTVPGEIRALQFEGEFPHSSTLGSVQARTVRLRGRLPNLLDKVFFREARTRIDRIEADRVEIEGVDVRFVRAKEIVLGRESHVTEVEGTITRRHPSSSVGPEVKSPTPYGLRR